jgi:UDP-2-acetamido-2-deoxy-ribo-hexuluronate aminotransferase
LLEDQRYILGPEVQALEKEIASYLGSQYSMGLDWPHSFIHALEACEIGPGDEVLCSSFTYIATADSVTLLGVTPVFVDTDPNTLTMDATTIEAGITQHTKAIIPVQA